MRSYKIFPHDLCLGKYEKGDRGSTKTSSPLGGKKMGQCTQ